MRTPLREASKARMPGPAVNETLFLPFITRTLTCFDKLQDKTQHVCFVPHLGVNLKYYSALVQTLPLIFTNSPQVFTTKLYCLHCKLRVQGNTTASWFLEMGCTQLCTDINGTSVGQ